MRRSFMWGDLVKEFMVAQINHWPLFAFFTTIIGVWSGPKPVMWAWALCSLLPFFLYLIRISIDPTFFFLVCHVLAGALYWILPVGDGMQQALMRFLVVCYLLRSCHLRLRSPSQKEAVMFPGLAFGIIAVSAFLLRDDYNGEWRKYYILPAIAYLGIYLIHYFLQRYLHFLSVNASSAGHIPAREILHSGLKLAMIYTGIGVVFLLFLSGLSLFGGIAVQLRRALMRLLRWLLGWLDLKSGEEGTVMEPFEPEVIPELPEGVSPPAFWILLQRIALVVVLTLFVAALLLGIAFLIYFLIRNFKGRARVQKVPVEEVTDVREKCEKESLGKEKKIPYFLLPPRERIRRIFKKKVIAGQDKILGSRKGTRLELITAHECAQRLEQEVLGLIYEKARYSEEECTAEDVRAIKE